MKRSFILLLTALSGYSAAATKIADSWKPAAKADVLTCYRKAIDWFAQTGNYRVCITYASFVDHSTTAAFDRSAGYYIRNGKNVHSCIMGIHTVQNDKLRFAVDTINKVMVLNDAGGTGQTMPSLAAFSDLLDHVKNVQWKQLPNGSSYRIEFRPNELYSAFEFELNEKGLLLKLKYFYSREMTEESDEVEDSDVPEKKEALKSRPRLEITFSGYQTAFTPDYEKEFSEKKYVRADGKKFLPAEKYKGYQVKDYRLNLKK